MSKKKKKGSRSKRSAQSQPRANAPPRQEKSIINQANDSYNHRFRSTVGMIIVSAVICFLAGIGIALALNAFIPGKDAMTWQIAGYIAAGTASLQVLLAIVNTIVVIPVATRIARRMMQRRLGEMFDDPTTDKVIDENEQESRIGPAAIAAVASFLVCLQYDAPPNASLWLPALSSATSPVVAHFTNHRTIRIIWKEIKGTFYKTTTRLFK